MTTAAPTPAHHAPCPYLARARWGDQLLAESTATLRVEEPGRLPQLWFPLADVRVDRLRDDGRTAELDGRGTARLWSIGPVDGDDVAWSFTDPAPGLDWLAGWPPSTPAACRSS